MKIILLEGIDGSGKTTAAKQLQYEMIKHNLSCKIMREPDGEFRKLLEGDLSKQAKLMLYLASRAELCKKLKEEKSDIIILDRFTPSTLVYQSTFDLDFLLSADEVARQNIIPDFTFYFEIDFETAIQRIAMRDNYEASEEERQFLFEAKQKYKQAIELLKWNYAVFETSQFSQSGKLLFNLLKEKRII